MSVFIMFALLALILVVIVQIARASEYAAILRGEGKVQASTNRMLGWSMLGLIGFGLLGVWWCHNLLKDKMLPVSASVQGVQYDFMLYITLVVTGIVFVITQVLLFWFAFRYQSTEKRTSFYYAHNNRLELIWTTVPAIVMAVLVAIGLRAWLNITSEAPRDAQVVEVVGKQFNWIIRYPGKDGVLGKRNFQLITNTDNVLGLDRTDATNNDDIVLENGEVHIVVNKPVKMLIGSRDVIHDVGLPHFRYKMDAVPGITTSIWFTPRFTTAQMKEMTGNPDFVYEISCDQICGKGHYAMRGTVIVETPEENAAWLAKQAPYLKSGQEVPALPTDTNAAPASGGPVQSITRH
jgi:cytochrome c oxidase subunit 2